MLRRAVWNAFTFALVRQASARRAHRRPDPSDRVAPACIGDRYPGLTDTPIVISSIIPASERPGAVRRTLLALALALRERWPMAAGYPTPLGARAVPYPWAYHALGPPPELAAGLTDDPIAHFASRGPFSLQTLRTPEGFALDLRHLERFAPRSPYLSAGGVARLRRAATGGLETVSVEIDGRLHRPDESGFALASRRLLCALNTHTTAIEHLLKVHLLTAGTFAVCTHEALPAEHPLRALLQPFTVEVVRLNNTYVDGLIRSERSNIPQYSGYPLDTVYRMMREATASFDIRQMDPAHRASLQGTLDDGGFPTVQSAVTLWRTFLALTREACAHVAPDDPAARRWIALLDARLPNGLRGCDDLAYLAALYAYVSSVGHHLVADMTRDAMLRADILPPVVDPSGQSSLGAAREKLNSVMAATVCRYRLLDDAPMPEALRPLWARFQERLIDYERGVPSGSRADHILPSRVGSSAHA